MRKRNRRAVVWLCALVLLLSGAAWAEADLGQKATDFKRVAPETATKGLTATKYFERQEQLHDWLLGETPDGVLANPITIALSREEIAEIDNPDTSQIGPLKVGVVEELDRPVIVSCRPVERGRKPGSQTLDGNCSGGGTVELTADGGFVWARAVKSGGAAGLRVHLTDLSLPDSADLYVLNLEGEAYGPYHKRGPNDDGDLWLPSVFSETAVILVRHFGPDGASELADLSLTITDVGHIGMGFYGVMGGEGDGDRAHCSYNASCVENATCGSTGPAAPAENAVAKMLWVAGCCINICTGGLIADTDSGSEIPYFLTANHCLSKNNAANNLEAFFQYQVSCGTSSCVGSFSPAPAPKTTGSSIKATSRSGDFTLLELDEAPPAGSVYLGWNNTPIATSGGAALHRISHPSGAPQAYSEHAVDANIGTCLNTPRGEFIYSDDVSGGTEGGSSGAPVVNASGEIVGQLTGCCGVGGGNCNDICNSNNHTIDGALAFYYSSVESFLDPSPCQPTTVSCSDGVDNDCDGLTDCDDTNGAEDCSSDPGCQSGCVNPGGLPAGSSCSSDGECCSDKCKGPPSNKTCR